MYFPSLLSRNGGLLVYIPYTYNIMRKNHHPPPSPPPITPLPPRHNSHGCALDTTFTKNTGHPFFHEWTSNQRSGRATNTTRLQIAVRVFFIPSKIRNIANSTSKTHKIIQDRMNKWTTFYKAVTEQYEEIEVIWRS